MLGRKTGLSVTRDFFPFVTGPPCVFLSFPMALRVCVCVYVCVPGGRRGGGVAMLQSSSAGVVVVDDDAMAAGAIGGW